MNDKKEAWQMRTKEMEILTDICKNIRRCLNVAELEDLSLLRDTVFRIISRRCAKGEMREVE